MKTLKWEYKVVYLPDITTQEENLNKIGIEGWELINIIEGEYKIGGKFAIFKRNY